MSIYSRFQELAENGRDIAGISARDVYRKLCNEGAVIAGLGVANLPLLDLLPAIGVRRLSVRDLALPDAATEARLAALGCHTAFSEGYLDQPMRGVVFRTPSLRPDHPALTEARRAGAIVLTEAALLLALTPADIFAVTGSDGKTTTAMMCAAILAATGRRTYLGGNIGTPLLSRICEMRATDALVVELSSFQLMDTAPPRGRCAITNITENHLDWHRDMAEYTAAKAAILGGGVGVLGAGCPSSLGRGDTVTVGHGDPFGAVAVFDERGTVYARRGGVIAPLFSTDVLPLPGRHNIENAMTAAALTMDAASPAAMADALSRFRGAPHRLTYVGCFHGVRCYDASIDTTPARTMTSLAALDGKPTVILGGRDKNLSYDALGRALVARARAAVLVGESADKLGETIARADTDGGFPTVHARDLAEAVAAAFALTEAGGTILLSPAATSFDAFKNYSERGDLFAALCRSQ